MRVRPPFVAIFPHAIVWLAPMFADELGALMQHLLHFVIKLFVFTDEMRNGFDYFAINIELQLAACGVANSYRPRTGESTQMRQLALGHGALAEHVVKNAQLRSDQPCRMQKPINERLRVILISETKKRVDGGGGIAQPSETIIPIQIAAGRLGKRCCWRRDNGAGRSVGKKFEHKRAARDLALIRPAVFRLPGPASPPIDGQL